MVDRGGVEVSSDVGGETGLVEEFKEGFSTAVVELVGEETFPLSREPTLPTNRRRIRSLSDQPRHQMHWCARLRHLQTAVYSREKTPSIDIISGYSDRDNIFSLQVEGWL